MKDNSKYQPQEIESRWQAIWEEKGIYQPDLVSAKRPFYNLMMFPYPSAEGLHVGNMYAFTGADINGRFKRMQGYDVFEPIGLDGFGIHSENYAIKIGKHPKEQAKVSETNFYRQLRASGNGFAWKNKVETYDPDYYRWTQWIFVQMFKHGLAYRKKSPVNFCPSCKTVLSDEQVIDGLCERCKSQVEKKEMEQWYFKITKYADQLLKNLDTLDWTNKVKIGQRNWIGKKEGIIINYPIIQLSNKPISNKNEIVACFTTRPDTNFGATFVVIGPEHPLVSSLLNRQLKLDSDKDTSEVARSDSSDGGGITKAIREYVEKAQKTSETERIAEGRKKTGVFTGFYAVNQLNNYKMPIYISDFVLGYVGTGAVVGVPGHDLRDFQLAKKFAIPVIRVVIGKDGDKSEITKEEQVQEEEGVMINSGFLDGLEIHQAIGKMMDHLEEKGWGKRVITYKLRDWCISRQRYWGAPIPMIKCLKCDWVPILEDQLPVLLPQNVKDWKPEGTGKGPLAKLKDWVKVKCPKCGGNAERETDVCDTFLDSSWYFLRYPSVNKEQRTKNKEQNSAKDTSSDLPWNPTITKKWLPVTQYIGGAEHTVLHLLYARFVTMALKDFGYLDFEEPFSRFYAHGLIIAEGAKMSKSRGNVVIPDAYIAKYGADTLRTYLMFLGPFDHGGDFRDTGIAGMYRFLWRVWRLVIEHKTYNKKQNNNSQLTTHNSQLNRFMHKTIKKVTEDMENLRYNTAIAHIMEFVNQLTESVKNTSDGGPDLIGDSSEVKESIKTLLLLLAPFAPHMTEELWLRLQGSSKAKKTPREWQAEAEAQAMTLPMVKESDKSHSIHLTPWPTYDPKYLVEDEVTIVIQVNGKTRETIKVDSRISQVQSEVEKIALSSPKVQRYLSPIPPKIPNLPNSPQKIIFLPGKLINFTV